MTLAEITALVKTNQMLVAGVGTVLLGSFMYVVKGVPKWLFYSAKRVTTLEMTLNSDSHSYFDILRTLNRYRIPFFSRCFSTDINGMLGVGYGLSVAWYRRRLVLFNRHLIETNMKLDERMDMTVLGRNPALLQSLIEEAQEQQETDYIKIYMSEPGGWWSSPIRKRKRSLDTIFINRDAKSMIIGRIHWFLANREWYLSRGIPYKLVFLLHGEPGTGKTSLVYGTASHFDYNLATLHTLANADVHIRNTPKRSFMVIEDIDMLSISREDDKDGSSKEKAPSLNTLHTLINTVDGLNTPDGLILFITTNYKERLDPALVRPGRIDCDMNIGRLDRDATETMFMAFFGERYQRRIRQYTRSNEFQSHTGAELQRMFACVDAESALRNLNDMRPMGAVA